MSDDIDTSPLTEEELAEARQYPMYAEWSDEDEAYLVTVPDLRGLRTHGETYDEAIEMGVEAAAVWISAMREMGRPIPPPSPPADGSRFPAPPRLDAAGVARIRQELGFSDVAFAALMNVDPDLVRAWERGDREPDGAALRLLSMVAHHPDAVLGLASRPLDADSHATAGSRNGRRGAA